MDESTRQVVLNLCREGTIEENSSEPSDASREDQESKNTASGENLNESGSAQVGYIRIFKRMIKNFFLIIFYMKLKLKKFLCRY